MRKKSNDYAMRKKETGRSPAEVEVKERKTSKASRNSWADIYNENTTLRIHKKILGQDAETDDGLEWRVKWGQRGSVLSALLTFICFIARQIIATIAFGSLTLIFMGILYYKNFSFVIAKRLLQEAEVVIIFVFALCNWSIDIVRPMEALSPILGLLYVLLVSAFVFIDAVKVKSRVFVIVVGFVFVLANINNIYNLIFGDAVQGVVLFKYTVQENEYTFMQRSTQRSIFIQIMLFSMNGIYTLFRDRKMDLMIFATGNIYRETGSTSKGVEQKSFITNTKSETRDHKASRNSWVEIYNETITLRKHKRLLGQEIETDESLEWRVKWGQRVVGTWALLGLIFIIAEQYFAAVVFCALMLIFCGMLYYKNVSFMIAKRLLREMNVIIILVLGVCNCVINIVRPRDSLDSALGLVYILAVSGFVFLDAIKTKSRMFTIIIGTLFILINFYSIYDRIFGDADQGVALLTYTIQGNEYAFMKRSVKRSIFIQVMLFSMNGIYTLLKDRKMELMIFCTGNIFRETGTSSKEVEQKSFVREIKSEKKSLSEI